MVKLDVRLLRFLEEEDFRVITALEMAMRNHDVAPTALVERIAQLPHGGCRKRLNLLLKHKFIHHENTAYDGYAMKYAAYDYLALRTLQKRGSVAGVGCRIGCGKESDIFLVEDDDHNEMVLKLQRLGRCSFRSVTRNRDYKNGKGRRGASWFYLSRLASQKEFAFMKMLYEEGFPVPKPIDNNRHAVLMEYMGKCTLLNNINEMAEAQKVYERCIALVVKLAAHGLIHGDFNEFNVLITEDLKVVMIDFPQMVSTDHRNAEDLFDRDINNLANFFRRRFRIETFYYPKLETDVERTARLDQQCAASGFFTKKQQQEFERLTQENLDIEASEDDEEDEEEECEECEEEQQESGSDVEEEEEKEKKPAAAASKKQHVDPAAATDATKAEDSASEEDEEETSSESGSESEADSEDERIANAKEARAVASGKTRRDISENPNFKKDGEYDVGFIRSKVKKEARHKDNADFRRTLHANNSKNRKTRKLKKQVKSGVKDHSLFDGDW